MHVPKTQCPDSPVPSLPVTAHTTQLLCTVTGAVGAPESTKPSCVPPLLQSPGHSAPANAVTPSTLNPEVQRLLTPRGIRAHLPLTSHKPSRSAPQQAGSAPAAFPGAGGGVPGWRQEEKELFGPTWKTGVNCA